MTILTAGTARVQYDTKDKKTAVYAMSASQTIYEGALVMATGSAGVAINAAATDSGSYVGTCTKTVTAASGDTSKEVIVEFGHMELFTTNVSLVGKEGFEVAVFDNDTVTTHASATSTKPSAGTVIEVVSTTKAKIATRIFSGRLV